MLDEITVSIRSEDLEDRTCNIQGCRKPCSIILKVNNKHALCLCFCKEHSLILKEKLNAK